MGGSGIGTLCTLLTVPRDPQHMVSRQTVRSLYLKLLNSIFNDAIAFPIIFRPLKKVRYNLFPLVQP
jgi:hypothetical protein